MRKVLLVFTGGTISMRIDPRTRGAVPVLSGREIMALVPGLDELGAFDVIDFARLPGPQMPPEKMFELAGLLAEQLQRDDIAGAVVTHGTDTLEETAYLLDLQLAGDKPVALVGALRNSSELGWDGPANLYAAVRTVLDPAAAGRGVLVVMNDTVHAASEVTKSDTQSLDAFRSEPYGPLAIFDKDRIVWRRGPSAREHIGAPRLETRVDLLMTAAGTDGRLLGHAIDSGAQGIVIAGTGRGNVPPQMLPAIQRAIDAGVPVVIASRCYSGRVLATYGYEGGGCDLLQRGALFSGFLPAQKARVKLMLALGCTRKMTELKRLIEGDAYTA